MAGLKENPFFILDVSMIETKESIIEATEEHSFDNPECEDEYEKAKNVLINPRLRLNAEIGWFPGLTKIQEQEVKKALVDEQLYHGVLSNPLAQFNLERYQLSYRKYTELPDAICCLDSIFSKFDDDLVRTWIDETRDIAKFPRIQDDGAVKAALETLLDDIRSAFHEFSKTISRYKYTEFANNIVKFINKPHGVILEEFFSTYELDINPYLQEAMGRIAGYVDNIKQDEKSFDIDKLEIELREWAKACRPIALLKANMGLTYNNTDKMFWHIRNLAIDVYNENENINLALRISKLLKDSFPYLLKNDSQYAEKLNEDINFLEDEEEEAKEVEEVSSGFNDAKKAFADMVETVDKELFFEDGHAAEIMKFYNNVFQRNYVTTIKDFLARRDILPEEKKVLYTFVAVIYYKMGISLTWADEFYKANLLAKKGLVYAEKSEDTEAITRYKELIADTTEAINLSRANSRATSATTVASNKNVSNNVEETSASGNNGCIWYIIFGMIGAAVAGMIGFFIGLAIAYAINDE